MPKKRVFVWQPSPCIPLPYQGRGKKYKRGAKAPLRHPIDVDKEDRHNLGGGGDKTKG